MKSNESDITKDGKFKILLSTKDIDRMDEEIKRIESNLKKTPDESSMIESGKMTKLTKEKEKHNVIDGVILFNTCAICHDKFKPTNSMINETSCDACSESKQVN